MNSVYNQGHTGNSGSAAGPFAPPPPPPPTPSPSSYSTMQSSQHKFPHPVARHVFRQSSTPPAGSSVQSPGDQRTFSNIDNSVSSASAATVRPQAIARGNSDLGLRLAAKKKVSVRHSLELSSPSSRRCGSAGPSQVNPLTSRSIAGSETQLFRPRVYNTTQGLLRTTPAIHLNSPVVAESPTATLASPADQKIRVDHNGSNNRSLPKGIPSSFTSFSTLTGKRRQPLQSSSLSSILTAVEREQQQQQGTASAIIEDPAVQQIGSDAESVSLEMVQVFVTSPVDDQRQANHSTIFEDTVLREAALPVTTERDRMMMTSCSNSSSSDSRSALLLNITPSSSPSNPEDDSEDETSPRSVIERRALIKSPASPLSPSLHPQHPHHPHHQHHHPHFKHHHHRSDHL